MAVGMKSKFRPCIDLHHGKVKQIVGSSLTDKESELEENFCSEQSAAYFAELYQENDLQGGHVIKLGPGNEKAAKEALGAWRGGLQIGGGICTENAVEWLEAGASHVIVTSFLFDANGQFREDKLAELVREVGRERLVIDLSCKRHGEGWTVAMNRWQTLTQLEITHDVLDALAGSCDEFLIHAADVEGKCQGIDIALVRHLAEWGKLPMTYAGGAAAWQDLEALQEASGGKLDVTIGSALDLFGGKGFAFVELVSWNAR